MVYTEPKPVLVGQEEGDEGGAVEALPTMDTPMVGKVQVCARRKMYGTISRRMFWSVQVVVGTGDGG